MAGNPEKSGRPAADVKSREYRMQMLAKMGGLSSRTGLNRVNTSPPDPIHHVDQPPSDTKDHTVKP